MVGPGFLVAGDRETTPTTFEVRNGNVTTGLRRTCGRGFGVEWTGGPSRVDGESESSGRGVQVEWTGTSQQRTNGALTPGGDRTR